VRYQLSVFAPAFKENRRPWVVDHHKNIPNASQAVDRASSSPPVCSGCGQLESPARSLAYSRA